MRIIFVQIFSAGFLLLNSCASKAPTAGKYSGLYEMSVNERITCHFLIKKEKVFFPTVVCHDSEQAWVVPLKDMPGQVWVTAPLLTKSGTIIALTDTDKKDAAKLNALISTDQGRDWGIQPLFLKKTPTDHLAKLSINKAGKLVATFINTSEKKYDVVQEATLKSKFTGVKSVAKSFDEVCFAQHTLPNSSKIPELCLSGYLKRLLNQ